MLEFEEFAEKAEEYNLIPLARELIADTDTPVSLYRHLSQLNDYSFLLESNTTTDNSNKGRYSFIGLDPQRVIKYKNKKITVTDGRDRTIEIVKNKNLLQYLEEYLNDIRVMEMNNLPPFSGGFVGYFGYEMIEEWESLYHNSEGQSLQKSDLPSTILVLAELVVAYDHLNNTVKIIDNIELGNNLSRKEKYQIYKKSQHRINDIARLIRQDRENSSYQPLDKSYKLEPEIAREDFKNMVTAAREYIKKGEVFQMVLSQGFSVETELSPFQIYRALRVSNPSPYLFYLNFPDLKMIGSSPEVLVKVKGDRVITRPLAGTRKRGDSLTQDKILQKELMSDEKERAEHIMLVDLGRNDLGRVCQTATVEVTELMGVEYYSQVMHLVSQVEGIKKKQLSGLEVLRSVFPAGTVTGAPKIRAIELINDLEKSPRGPYAGAVGYLDFSGNIDTCITIRTFFYQDSKLSVQAGAGIVYDSNPEKEYQETLSKARALFQALDIVKKEGLYGLSH